MRKELHVDFRRRGENDLYLVKTVLYICCIVLLLLMLCRLERKIRLYTFLSSNEVGKIFFWSSIHIIVAGVIVVGFAYSTNRFEGVGIFSMMANHIVQLNVLYLFLLTECVFFLCGSKIAVWINFWMYAALIIANYLKLRYHGTFFTWLDLYQIKELFLIGIDFLSVKIVAALIIVFGGLIFVPIGIIKLCGKMAMKPKITHAIIASLIFGIMTFCILNNKFENMGMYSRTWENVRINIAENGVIGNLILDIKSLDAVVMEKPSNYNAETAENLKKEFDKLAESEKNNSIQPNVVLILAESLIDMEDIDGIRISKDIDNTLDKYKKNDLISPRYGGYTSAVEFEVLTGLSLAFMPESLTPYTTYFNDQSDTFPSITQEFRSNNYDTKVIHPNLPDFYNRTIVYKNMGFEEYQSILSFDSNPETTTKNGWITDQVLGERIINELEKAGDSPTFIYALTMEDHYVNVDKYDKTDIKIESDLLDDIEKKELEQQAQSYYNLDNMIKSLIQYIDKTDKPTLLYVFGDHLPPIEAFDKLGYISDKENKYRTRLLVYSNYKEVNIEPKLITPNQLAAQIMIDSGISHHNYFDYIYSFRKTYPILHREFIELTNNPDLDTYRFIQYDLLFGNRYLLR